MTNCNWEAMSRLNSPSSNNSGTSSETSETQSVEENSKFFTNLTPENFDAQKRAPKSWKRMKEIGGNQSGDAENKRPPWRAVSVSTLPKPDKNAILRAKLLDASSRCSGEGEYKDLIVVAEWVALRTAIQKARVQVQVSNQHPKVIEN